jgi:class 3 adenylate cyclase
MGFLHSIVTKNIGLFLLILLGAIVPLALRYDQDSRDAEIRTLASKLEFFAQRGATWIDAAALDQLQRPEDKQTDAYRTLLAALRRIEREFSVDNAVLMRRESDGSYTYIAAGHDGFEIREPAGIHTLFPATYRATNDTWAAGEMMHSQLFGGRVGDTEYDKFLQINTPLKRDGAVVAILMLNKFANPVAAAVRERTLRVIALSAALVALGLALFAIVSARMLRPLKQLTAAAGQVAGGDLSVALPPIRRRDEVGRLSRAFAGMVEGLRQRDFIRDTFGRYVTREVVDELLGSPDGLKLGGEVREVTILVTDLRGFTALASTLRPDAVLEILNRYLERMVAVLQRYHGTIDEIQGDGLLTFFGAPLAAGDDAPRAVACAVEMQRALAELNAEQRRLGRPELAMGIGINTGEVVIGNIGSERRTKYGAVGTPINMAYRIESETVGGQILISEETYRRVQHVVKLRGTLRVELKGLDRPLTLYDVAAVAGEYGVSLPEAGDDALRALDAPVDVTCYRLEGKNVSPVPIAGQLVAVGANGAELLLQTPVAERSNVKLLVATAAAGPEYELYAKVVGLQGGRARLAFTSVPDAARAYLAERAMR